MEYKVSVLEYLLAPYKNMKLNELFAALEGKKSYIIALALVVFAFVGVYLGVLDQTKSFEIVLEALGLGALRSAIKK